MIDKKEFQKAVMDYASNPNDTDLKDEYFRNVVNLAECITKSYKMAEVDDTVQDLIEYSIVKRLHTRIDPKKSAFNYYWTCLGNHIWYMNEKRKKDPIRTFDMWESSLTDEGAGEKEMLRKLGFVLEDYEGDTVEDIIESIETVEVTKGKRGRPKTKEPGQKAAHWEYLFKTLKRKKTMTEGALVKQLPSDKLNALKNPEKSVNYYMRTIANREGCKLSISNNGKHNVYMIVGE